MADLQPIFGGVTQIAGIDDDIAAIKAIVEAAKSWDVKKPQGFADITALLTQLHDKVDDAQVVAAFDTLGLASARTKVAALLKKVEALGKRIPDWVRTLIRPLDSFNETDSGELSWKPVSVDQKVPLDAPFSLGIKGGFSLACAASTTTDAFKDEKKRLMKLAVHGDVSAEGGASIPYSLGTIKAGAKAGLALDLAYYFDETGSKQLYVAALAENLVQLPLPFDYESVWAAVGKPGFAGLDYVFAANVGANVEVGLAYLVEAGGDLKFDVGGTVSVAASYARGYRLSLYPRRNGTTALAVSLKRTRLSAVTLGASLEVTVDAPKLRARVQDIVKTKLAVWDQAREKIEPILSPGTYLQTKLADQLHQSLGKLIGNADLRKALEHDLGVVLGHDTSDKGLTDWLSDAIKGAIDRYSSKLTGQAETAVSAVVDGVMDDLGSFVPASARDAVKGEIAKLVEAAHAGFKDAVQKLLDSYAGDAKGLKALLEKAGAKVQGAVDTLDGLLKAVRDLLDKYNKAIHDIAEKAQAAAEKKVSLAVSYQNKRSHELTLKIGGAFTDPGKGSDLFKWLIGGDLSKIRDNWNSLRAGGQVGFQLDDDSSIEDYYRTDESLALEIVALGFGATFTGTLTADAKAIVDAAGNVQIDSSATFKDRFESKHLDRSVSFGDVLTAAAARSRKETKGSVSRTMKLGVSVGYSDKKYTQAKLGNFLDELDEHRLISHAEAVEALEAFGTLVAGSAQGTAKAEISAELWLEAELAETALLLGPGMRDPATGKLTPAGTRRVFEAGLAGLVSAAVESNNGSADDTTKQLKGSADYVIGEEINQGNYGGAIPDALVDKYLLFDRDFVEGVYRYYKGFPNSSNWQPYVFTYRRLDDLAKVIAGLGRAYQALPDGPTAWSPSRYRDEQSNIARDSESWLSTNAFLFAGQSVAPIVLALMLALDKLAGGVENPVTLTLIDQSDPAKPRAIAIGSGP
jgi:hypothetical protein